MTCVRVCLVAFRCQRKVIGEMDCTLRVACLWRLLLLMLCGIRAGVVHPLKIAASDPPPQRCHISICERHRSPMRTFDRLACIHTTLRRQACSKLCPDSAFYGTQYSTEVRISDSKLSASGTDQRWGGVREIATAKFRCGADTGDGRCGPTCMISWSHLGAMPSLYLQTTTRRSQRFSRCTLASLSHRV